MMARKHSCCTIIVTYNGMRWLPKCVESLKNSTTPTDIVVVDNNSSDGSIEFLGKTPEVVLFKNETNVGFARANNIGITYAYQQGYESFFLLNQDAWIEPETIQSLIDSQSGNDDYGILSPIHLDGSGESLDSGFKKYMRLRKSSGFYKDFYYKKFSREIYEVSFVNAAAWMVSKKCISEVGLFHPLFDHYGEDDNYIHRVQHSGLKVGVVKDTHIFHDRKGRYKKRINARAKFRSMVLMVHLNPLKKRGPLVLWWVSMGNLFSIPNFWHGLPKVFFYIWGFSEYFKMVKKIHLHHSNPDDGLTVPS